MLSAVTRLLGGNRRAQSMQVHDLALDPVSDVNEGILQLLAEVV